MSVCVCVCVCVSVCVCVCVCVCACVHLVHWVTEYHLGSCGSMIVSCVYSRMLMFFMVPNFAN